jgi:very-short-patch-repair endonuclease
MPKKLRKSEWEDHLETRLIQSGLGGYVKEFKAIPGRKYEWDFAYPKAKLLIEVQGATYVKGSHSTGTGIRRDCEKLNLATIAGWRCLLFTSDMVRDDLAHPVIADALLQKTSNQ